jgi:2,4-dienoyl-CoA reductase-like NADH-dependent reductase (Old Yellow Enzyme family)
MKDGKIGYRIADNQDSAVPETGEHNFQWLELAMGNQDSCSSPGCKHWNHNQIPGWKNWFSFAHKKDCRIVPRMVNY